MAVSQKFIWNVKHTNQAVYEAKGLFHIGLERSGAVIDQNGLKRSGIKQIANHCARCLKCSMLQMPATSLFHKKESDHLRSGQNV